jgi:hypothetical protein
VVDAYLSREHLDDVEGSGPLIGLPSDAARSGKGVKSAYRQVAESMIRLFESNLSGPEAHEQALVFVSLCVGGMVLARGIDDDSLGSELRDAAQSHILKLAGWRNGRKQKKKPRNESLARTLFVPASLCRGADDGVDRPPLPLFPAADL